jgi:hypothetical protein
VLPERIESDDIASLAKSVASEIEAWERDIFVAALRESRRPLPVLRVEIENLPDPQLATEARRAVELALTRAAYVIDSANPNALTLRMRFGFSEDCCGVRRGEWRISFIRPDGSVAGSSRYVSAVGSRLVPSTVSAFSEAATVAQLQSLSAWGHDPALVVPSEAGAK